MARKVQHSLLAKAKANKKDEFYTQLIDIESELEHYESHFKDKVVYCNCDDPRMSNFFNYFSSNFENLGLKKLITACYKSQERDLFNKKVIENGIFSEYPNVRIGKDQSKKDRIDCMNQSAFKCKTYRELPTFTW